MGPTPTCSTIPHAKIPQLAYLSAALAHLKADDYAHMRHMRIKLPEAQGASRTRTGLLWAANRITKTVSSVVDPRLGYAGIGVAKFPPKPKGRAIALQWKNH